MSQEWDIDDILASLDELLQERKEDEDAEKKKTSSVHLAAKNSIGNIKKKVEIKTEVSSKTEKSAAMLEHKKDINVQDIEKIKIQAPKPLEGDMSDTNFRQEPSINEHHESIDLPRVVLTQDMIVKEGHYLEDAFTPLLETIHDSDEHKTVEKRKHQQLISQVQGIHLNVQQVEQVLELVSIDVSYQFNQLLPDMIRQSLHTHLTMMQNEQTEQQNKQKNEKS